MSHKYTYFILVLIIPFQLLFSLTQNEKNDYDKGVNLYKKKEFSQAYKYFDEYIEKYQSGHYLPMALFYKAKIEKDYFSTILLYKELISRFPDHKIADEAMYHLAKLYYMHNNYTESRSIFNRLIKKYKKSNFIYGSHYYLGSVYLIKNNFSDAIDEFDCVIEQHKKDKFHKLSLIQMGNCYYEKREYKEAIPHYNKCFILKDKNYYPSIFLGLGNCYLKLKDYDKAYEYFRKIKKEYSGSAEYELAIQKIEYIKDNKTIFDSINWDRFKADERPVKKKPDEHYFTVQVASVQNVRYANDLRIKLKTSGYKTRMERIKTDKGLFYRTLVGKYKTRAEAEKILQAIERKFKLKCVILEIK